MVEAHNPEIEVRPSLYSHSKSLSFIFGRLCNIAKSDSIGIFFVSLFWLLMFFISSLLDGTLVMGRLDFNPNAGNGMIEDIFGFSLLFSLFFILFLIKKMLQEFDRVFLDDNELQENIDWKRISKEEYFQIINNSRNFIEHTNLVDLRWRALLITIRAGALIFLLDLLYMWLSIPITANNDYWMSRNHFFGPGAWISFLFFS